MRLRSLQRCTRGQAWRCGVVSIVVAAVSACASTPQGIQSVTRAQQRQDMQALYARILSDLQPCNSALTQAAHGLWLYLQHQTDASSGAALAQQARTACSDGGSGGVHDLHVTAPPASLTSLGVDGAQRHQLGDTWAGDAAVAMGDLAWWFQARYDTAATSDYKRRVDEMAGASQDAQSLFTAAARTLALTLPPLGLVDLRGYVPPPGP